MRRSAIIRLGVPTLILATLCLASGCGLAWYIRLLRSKTSKQLEESASLLSATQALARGARVWEEKISVYLSGDPSTGNAELNSLGEAMQRRLETIAPHAGELHDMPPVSDIAEAWARLRDAVKRGPATLRVEMQETFVTGIKEPVAKLVEEVTRMVERTREENDRIAGRIAKLALALGGLGALGGILGGFVLGRFLRRSLVGLRIPVRDAAGKLNRVVGPIEVTADGSLASLEDELADVARHVEEVVGRLQRTEREISRSEQLKAVGQLAAGMAHELLNPLTAIKMLVEAARESDEKSALSEHDLAVLHEQILKQEKSIRSFLEFARPPTPTIRPFDATEVVERTVELVEPRAERQNVRLHRVHAEGLPMVEGDADQIRQVLLNLLFNALDALPSGGDVHVELEVESRSDGSWVVLRIRDSGPGIPVGLGDRIFEPFLSRKETGTGLGLSISKRIVEEHGGTIEARDADEGGAVFTVRLPVKK